jgi:hypothetical protein
MNETAGSGQPAKFDREALGRAARSIQHPLARALLLLTFTTGLVDAVSYRAGGGLRQAQRERRWGYQAGDDPRVASGAQGPSEWRQAAGRVGLGWRCTALTPRLAVDEPMTLPWSIRCRRRLLTQNSDDSR